MAEFFEVGLIVNAVKTKVVSYAELPISDVYSVEPLTAAMTTSSKQLRNINDIEACVLLRGKGKRVVFELHHRFLDRNATQAELLGDLVAVQAISRPELAGQDQIDHV